MKDALRDATEFLVKQGWEEGNPFVFRKSGYELVFDTSSYIEVYYLETSERIAEFPISELQNNLLTIEMET